MNVAPSYPLLRVLSIVARDNGFHNMSAKALAVLFVNCNKHEWRKQCGKCCTECNAFAIYVALQDQVSGIAVVLQHESSLAIFYVDSIFRVEINL